ncbi:MAG: hypothetical protein JSV18_02615 [Candidatus Bathyarchaeota archaeon]|nr:MAG: hypothetical protein JSV18_02615 [Candidatus Bathyarchaeota archaeon]
MTTRESEVEGQNTKIGGRSMSGVLENDHRGDSENEGDTLKLLRSGLHFCSHYKNLVKYNLEFCGGCPYNGLKTSQEEAS